MSGTAEKIDALLKLSRDLGREDRGLAILGEGNASCRLDAETFSIKASGASLGTLQPEHLVTVRFDAVLPLLEQPDLPDKEVEQALLAARVDAKQPKPSIEAVFHAYLLTLPGVEVVGHTHPLAVNQILCAEEKQTLKYAGERRFPDEVVCCGARSAVVPYVDPGTPLARGIRESVDKFQKEDGRPPRVVLLRNHGLIALAATTGSVLSATLMAEKAAQVFVGAQMLGGAVPMSEKNVARIDSRPDEHYRQRLIAK